MATTEPKRETAREEYFYRLGQYEEAKAESIDDKHVRVLWTVVQNAKSQL